MTNSTTHNRSVILCLGGWGLQVGLHLLPRLRFSQEQRLARGISAPDLTRITGFAALNAHPWLGQDGRARLDLFQIPGEVALPPFAIEKALAQSGSPRPVSPGGWFGTGAGGPSGASMMAPPHPLLTSAEAQAQALFHTIQATLPDALLPLSADRAPAPDSPHRATRADTFQAAAEQADSLARRIRTHIIDPVRSDTLIPGDPFVQTTIYVVAPLFEPLVSATIWPVLAQLIASLGERHLFQMVAFLGTGSHALDASRATEDAAAFAALRELTLLSGHDPDLAARNALRESIPMPLADQVGRNVFDQIYLIDREKSNQGLAQSGHELAVLVANALEALVTGDASQLIQEQLGAGARILEQRPFSILGAATDYVPLDAILQAAGQQEEKRLARELILAESPDPADLPYPDLAGLGIKPEQALASLVARHPDLFENQHPVSVSDLAVSERFVLDPATAAELRGHKPTDWELVYTGHQKQVRELFDLVADANGAWGLDGLDDRGNPKPGTEDQLLPAVVEQMQATLLDMAGTTPGGLSTARRQVQAWLDQVEESRHALRRQAAPGMRRLQQAQRTLAVRDWQRSYHPRAVRHPRWWAVGLRATLVLLIIVALSVGYLLATGQAWTDFSLVPDGALLAGIALGAYAAGGMALTRYKRRLEDLRAERVALDQADLTALLQERARTGLTEVYARMAEWLQRTELVLSRAVADVADWSQLDAAPTIPPAEVAPVHLFVPHMDDALWARCRDHLRSREDPQGHRGEERLGQLWGGGVWRKRMGFLLFGGPRPDAQAPRSVANLVAETVAQAVAPVTVLGHNRDVTASRMQLIRELAYDHTVEHLGWRKAQLARPAHYHPYLGWTQEGETTGFGYSNGNGAGNGNGRGQDMRRFLESLWNRAKPTANYDVADRLVVTGVEVDFAAVSGGGESDMNESVLREYRLARLVTGDPFTVTCVRTVHGLGLDDLESVHHYRAELGRLAAPERGLVLLADGRFYEERVRQPT
ncbi:MAG: hypothetical protein KBG20_12545 [Caldilineaceae bacterium]|nr:hypothetical protein [Caldilineaceae bacterium]MBP8107810.1 hypothetical protein [Caldilineaceae bacterium]MBP8121635.1 hypothetical protein [Caldilineaceae bacterium]MBP9073127.1 hypothetical protein [Caldilineaceae bacterium]